MESTWVTASAWMGLALLASLVSIRLAVSVALVEIVAGIVAGNLFGVGTNPWIDFLGALGSVVLTFLAGAEIDPSSFRANLKSSLTIGTLAFVSPFLGAAAYARYVAGWPADAAWIAGIALSTTSVAVVYAVMVETGLNDTPLGKAVLAACFVNDLGTVLALGIIFAGFSFWMAGFAAATALAVVAVPRLGRRVIAAFGGRVQAVEIKFLLLVLFLLGALANQARSEAVLPAYVVGLAVAGLFQEHKELVRRLRVVTFTLLTPFFFIKAGLFVSASAMVASLGLVVAFFAVKMVTKLVGVRPLTGVFGYSARQGNYITALMSTGLTFGTISALYGLSHGIIDRPQYTILVTVVILSAVLPTLVAQRWFLPEPGAAQVPVRGRVAGAPTAGR